MLRRHVLLSTFGLVLAGTMPALAAGRPLTADEKQLINAISTYNSSIKSMVGRFVQIDSDGKRIDGVFFLQRPDKINFRYNPPSRQEIVSVGRGFYVIDRQQRTEYAYPQDKVPLRQFLSDHIDLLSANIIDMSQSDSYATITLQDSTPEGTVQVALVFDKSSMDLSQWVLTEPSGQELTFSLYDVQKNVDIPKSYFYIDATYTSKPPQT